MHALALPTLPANASADQADAWLAAFAESRQPTAVELAAVHLGHASAYRVLAETARKGSTNGRLPNLNREVLTLLAMRAELAATERIRAADIADPLPF